MSPLFFFLLLVHFSSLVTFYPPLPIILLIYLWLLWYKHNLTVCRFPPISQSFYFSPSALASSSTFFQITGVWHNLCPWRSESDLLGPGFKETLRGHCRWNYSLPFSVSLLSSLLSILRLTFHFLVLFWDQSGRVLGGSLRTVLGGRRGRGGSDKSMSLGLSPSFLQLLLVCLFPPV